MPIQNKRIHLESLGKVHSAFRTLIAYPPEGYEFFLSRDSRNSFWRNLAYNHFVIGTYDTFARVGLVPWKIVSNASNSFKTRPTNADLTFSCGQVVLRNEPWVVEIEWVTQLAGFSLRELIRRKEFIEDLLASDNCKRIICMCELTRQSAMYHLDCNGIGPKLETLYRVVPPKKFARNYEKKGRARILFVGTSNVRNSFAEEKGGLELLEAIRLLNREHAKDLEFVIRSKIPRRVSVSYRDVLGSSNVRVIQDVIPMSNLEMEFELADIFLLPAHHTPSLAFLDAMSYELPVVTLDSWANSEIVTDGRTGFLVALPTRFEIPAHDFVPFCKYPVKRVPRKVDSETVETLADRVMTLVDDIELRRKMGEAGRSEVERGRFSIKVRNEKLKRILDGAVYG